MLQHLTHPIPQHHCCQFHLLTRMFVAGDQAPLMSLGKEAEQQAASQGCQGFNLTFGAGENAV